MCTAWAKATESMLRRSGLQAVRRWRLKPRSVKRTPYAAHMIAFCAVGIALVRLDKTAESVARNRYEGETKGQTSKLNQGVEWVLEILRDETTERC